MIGSEAAEHVFVAVHRLQKKKVQDDESLTADRHNYCTPFFVKERSCFDRVFQVTLHEVGTASAAQIDRTH